MSETEAILQEQIAELNDAREQARRMFAKEAVALRQQLAETGAERDRARELMSMLLDNVGVRAACRGCDREIIWVRHKNGKQAPYDADGINHFATCVQAAQFRTRRAASGKDNG